MSTKNIFCVLMLAFLLTGCEITGNPGEGGIFRSETKARQRQDALKTEQAAAKGQRHLKLPKTLAKATIPRVGIIMPTQ